MTELAKSISKLICVVTVKTGDDGKMFGTVTSGMIADQLKTQFDVSLDKRKVHLEHPIRTLGEHEGEMRLQSDVVTRLKLRVESSTPVVAHVTEPAAEARREEPRTEKRGRRPEASAAPAGAKAEGKADEKGGDRKSRAPRPERPARQQEKPAKA